MKSGPFIDLVADTLGIERGTTRVVARSLREAGWLTTGPRGKNAPDMKARDASRLVIALMTGAAPSRALSQFEIFRALKLGAQDGRINLKKKLKSEQIDTIDDCLTRFIQLLVDGEDPARLEHSGAWLVNYELIVNETARSAFISLGESRFHFFDFSPHRATWNDHEPIAEEDDGAQLNAIPTPREVIGIQTFRTVSYREMKTIADGLSGRTAQRSSEHAVCATHWPQEARDG